MILEYQATPHQYEINKGQSTENTNMQNGGGGGGPHNSTLCMKYMNII